MYIHTCCIHIYVHEASHVCVHHFAAHVDKNVTVVEHIIFAVSSISTSSWQCFFKRVDRLNGTGRLRTIIAVIIAIVVVRRNRFFSEWKEKMDYGRSVIGIQTITIPICPIPINFGLVTFQLNQSIHTTAYATHSTLCDHTID